MGSYVSKVDDYDIVDYKFHDNDSLLITQVVRKAVVLKDLEQYFKNANRESVYYKFIIGTIEYETLYNITTEYKLYSNFIYNIFRMQKYDLDNI